MPRNDAELEARWASLARFEREREYEGRFHEVTNQELEDFKRDDQAKGDIVKTYEYQVDRNHSTVLGYPAGTSGRQLWEELDWSAVRKDGGQHLFNPAGGEYLHVRVKYDADQDGPSKLPVEDYDIDDRRWYRVRCLHEIGSKWRGGIVKDVKVEYRTYHGWYWIVSVEK